MNIEEWRQQGIDMLEGAMDRKIALLENLTRITNEFANSKDELEGDIEEITETIQTIQKQLGIKPPPRPVYKPEILRTLVDISMDRKHLVSHLIGVMENATERGLNSVIGRMLSDGELIEITGEDGSEELTLKKG